MTWTKHYASATASQFLRDGAVIQQGNPQEIILHPADDYIFDFVKDINRARVIEVKSVMSGGEKTDGPNLLHNIVLEDALQEIAHTETQAGNVIDDNDNIIGSIHIDQIIQGIARPKVEAENAAKYK